MSKLKVEESILVRMDESGQEFYNKNNADSKLPGLKHKRMVVKDMVKDMVTNTDLYLLQDYDLTDTYHNGWYKIDDLRWTPMSERNDVPETSNKCNCVACEPKVHEYTDTNWREEIANRQWNRKNLLEALQAGPVEVVFIKRNGTLRVMYCTLDADFIPEADPNQQNSLVESYKYNPDIIYVFDLESDAWRSFHISSIKDVTTYA